MVLAARISEQKGYLSTSDRIRIESLLSALGLPLHIACPWEKLLWAMRNDKKREAEKIRFVLLKNLGQGVVEEMTFEELGAYSW